MVKKIVWEFTNQRKLTKKEFLNYFERKVFRTIRKYKMLTPTKEGYTEQCKKNKVIKLKKSNSLNTAVLKKVIEKKFKVKFTTKPDFSSDNLSQIAEDVFKNILQGKFNSQKPSQNTDDKLKKPLYFLSDREIELYTKLTNIKGTKRKQNKKIQSLFAKFLKKNQDLEQNIVKALSQL